MQGGPWSDEWWGGTSAYAFAVVRRGPAAPRAQDGGKALEGRVLSHRIVKVTNMEDARLFRDDKGKIRSVHTELMCMLIVSSNP